MSRLTALFLTAFLLSACIEGDGNISPPSADADIYVPVYGDPATAKEISIGDPKPISDPAKIFVYQDYLMVNIRNEGFHVIDNSIPTLPRPLFFINVPGNQDVAIKDGVIYADNYSDIVAFIIDDNQQLQVVSRLENVMNNQLYPPFTNVYFECVDPSKGVVIDWVKADIPTPDCYR